MATRQFDWPADDPIYADPPLGGRNPSAENVSPLAAVNGTSTRRTLRNCGQCTQLARCQEVVARYQPLADPDCEAALTPRRPRTITVHRPSPVQDLVETGVRAHGPISFKALCIRLGVDRWAMHSALKRLIERGLVQRLHATSRFSHDTFVTAGRQPASDDYCTDDK
jgi:hypothetical protein